MLMLAFLQSFNLVCSNINQTDAPPKENADAIAEMLKQTTELLLIFKC